MANNSVTIILPHGRRFTMKVTPNTSIQQVLEDACLKVGLNPDETDLIHQKKVLDTGLTVRFANLPNNVSLELQASKFGVKTKKLVTVGLQLESGERLLHDFPCSTTLWSIILHWSQIRGESFGKGETQGEPVCIYMRREIIGEKDLTNTTLSSLGITGGRVMIRLVYKVPSSLKEQAYVEDLKLKKSVEIDNWVKDVRNETNNEVETLPANSAHSVPHKSQESGNPLPSKPAFPIENLEPRSKGNEIERNEEAKDTANNFPKMKMDTDNRKPVLAVPHDKEDDQMQVEEPQQEEKLVYIGERDALLFNLDNVAKLTEVDLPEDYFEHTEKDVRYLYSEIKKQLHHLEEGPLMLTSQITHIKENKSLRYKNAIVRVHFPNRLVLQAKFEPKDKISTIKDFLKQFLTNPALEFYLYTTPPKTILNEELQLYEGDLVPAAIVHFGCDVKDVTNFLKDEVMKNVSTLKAASLKASSLWDKCDITENNNSAVLTISTPSTSGYANSGSLHRDQQGLDNVNQPRPITKNTPKWFKLGK